MPTRGIRTRTRHAGRAQATPKRRRYSTRAWRASYCWLCWPVLPRLGPPHGCSSVYLAGFPLHVLLRCLGSGSDRPCPSWAVHGAFPMRRFAFACHLATPQHSRNRTTPGLSRRGPRFLTMELTSVSLKAVLAPGAVSRPGSCVALFPRLPAQPYCCPPGRNRTANPAGKRRTGRCGADYAGGHDGCWRGRSAPNDPNTVDRPHDPRQRGARRECLSSVAGRDPKDAAAAISPLHGAASM